MTPALRSFFLCGLMLAPLLGSPPDDSAPSGLPVWNYSIVSPVNGMTYTGNIVGRNPYYHGHRTTAVRAYLVPVRVTFEDSGTVFDPTVNKSCDSDSALNLTARSPLFQAASYTMNGVNVGTGQYLDEFQRANFWSRVSGTPYHTTLDPKILAPINLTVPVADGSTQAGFFPNCPYGLLEQGWFDQLIRTQILPALAGQGIGPGNLPLLLFDSIFGYLGDPSNCCQLGYHAAFPVSSGGLQSYAVLTWDTSGAFGGDIFPSSIVVGGWLDNPFNTNAAPPWRSESQRDVCGDQLEVGGPLLFTSFPPVVLNSYTYNPVELAFFSWFFRQSPSLGAGGLYSDNGTLQSTESSVCPNTRPVHEISPAHEPRRTTSRLPPHAGLR